MLDWIFEAIIYVLDIARAPYTALMDVAMTGEDFSFAGIEAVLKNGLVQYVSDMSVVGALLQIILLIALGWNYEPPNWKMLIILIPYKSGAYYDTYLFGVAYPFSFCLVHRKALQERHFRGIINHRNFRSRAMIKELMHDPIFLAGKSEDATKEDIAVANDLLETLMAHRESCVGMAANMIGVRKRIIAFLDESGRQPTYTVMLNPVILKKDKPYDTEEGCLSLLGGPRKCKRYKTIKVQYQTLEMQTRTKNFEGWTAQIIQHEVDHCNGVLI